MNSTRSSQKGAKSLKGRLENYSLSARSAATQATLKQRARNWPVYAAVAGSALAMATSASADTIIPFNLNGQPTTVTEPAGPGTNINFPIIPHQGSGPEFLLGIHGNSASGFGTGLFGGIANGHPIELLTNGTGGGKRANGDLISADAGPWARFGADRASTGNHSIRRLYGLTTNAPLFNGFTAEAGFRFATPNFQMDQGIDYGWLKLELTASGDLFSLHLLSGAYEIDPGVPIMAGETLSSPEPGTAGMMLLALGAAGVTALRRRKQQIHQS